MCLLLCFLIAMIALNAHKARAPSAAASAGLTCPLTPRPELQIIVITVAVIEGVINFLVQFLLRRIVNVNALQGLLNLAQDPKRALGLAKRSGNPPPEPGTIVKVTPLSIDKTTALSASDVQDKYAEDDDMTEISGKTSTESR